PPYYHTVHTYVHSFPTRRSSDLTTVKTCFCLDIEAGIERCGSGPAVAPRGDVAPEIKVSNISICPIDQHNRRMANLEVQVFDKEIGKSTRLNSSHVKNSYAVFCL